VDWKSAGCEVGGGGGVDGGWWVVVVAAAVNNSDLPTTMMNRSHRPGSGFLTTTDRKCGAVVHDCESSLKIPPSLVVRLVVRRLDISRSSTPAFGVCGVVELNGLTLAPPGSAHVFVGVLRSDGRRRVVDDDGRGRFSTARWHTLMPKSLF